MTAFLRHVLGIARALAACVLLLCACSERRDRGRPAPVYQGDLATLLERRCARCHAGSDATAGVRLDSYLDLFSCATDAGGGDAGATSRDSGPADAGAAAPGARLLAALERTDHRDLLDAGERARLGRWLALGAPLRERGIHEPGILDPRSRDWHGRLASVDGFGPLREAQRADACGRCHDGAPVQPTKDRAAAQGAPACTSCHREPEGVLACSTCHGDGAARAYPPRDRCLFPGSRPDAHDAHLRSVRIGGAPLVCSTCHPYADRSFQGHHADGFVDILLDRSRAGADAGLDLQTRRCAVACHDRGGAHPRPTFDDPGPMGCGDCHGSPPQDHYAGACDGCHVGPNADGTALPGTELHLNGRVDVGRGDGGASCGSCHGQGEDAMPQTAGHLLHRDTALSVQIACAECHTVPARINSEGHLDRGKRTPPDVVFGARARAFGQESSYEDGVCRNVACHGAGIGADPERALRWDERGSQQCSGCHGLPPGGEHPQDDRCASTICHGSAVQSGSPPVLTARGFAQHIDGKIDVGGR